MTALATRIAGDCLTAIDARLAMGIDAEFVGTGSLPSAFAVTDFAAGSIAAAGCAVAALIARAHGGRPTLRVDRRLASFWFQTSIRPIGWEMPGLWDSIAGDYVCRDGWIRLHTNAPAHRAAAQRVLGGQEDRIAMARAVATRDGAVLEAAIVATGGCAAQLRTEAEWVAHPQGQAVASEPLVHVESIVASPAPGWTVPIDRPLRGVKVLDLTRVLAGPIATRFLAGYGAEVLRIDAPAWDEPAVVPEVTLGKRCARLDLKLPADRASFERLLAQADVLIHGYRPGALDALGYGNEARRRIVPGLIDVSLDAYGWSGPWATRRGFDSLVQMSSGIAHAGMAWRSAEVPTPLPAQALDHATGYLMAACAVAGIGQRLTEGRAMSCRVSLARTASLLLGLPREPQDRPLAPEREGGSASDFATQAESTSWGDARRLKPALQIEGAPMRWERGACRLGGHAPQFIG